MSTERLNQLGTAAASLLIGLGAAQVAYGLANRQKRVVIVGSLGIVNGAEWYVRKYLRESA